MNMESNDSGAEKDQYYERRAVERKALLDDIRRRLIERNAQPISREDFERQVTVAVERNRKKAEEQRQKEQGDHPTDHDNAA